ASSLPPWPPAEPPGDPADEGRRLLQEVRREDAHGDRGAGRGADARGAPAPPPGATHAPPELRVLRRPLRDASARPRVLGRRLGDARRVKDTPERLRGRSHATQLPFSSLRSVSVSTATSRSSSAPPWGT